MGQREVLTASTFGRRMRERYARVREREGKLYSGIGLKCV